MKKINFLLLSAFLISFTSSTFSQTPNLGSAADFVLFSGNGAVTNSGISQLTGNVGTNNGSSTFFGNVNGIMHDNDTSSARALVDLMVAYNYINTLTPTFFPAPLLGNGDTLIAGIYSIAAASTLNSTLYLNAQNNPNAIFIIQIQAPFSANANSKVKLLNGALACNVFWKVEGLVSMAAGTSMKGTIIANNAAITMSAGDTLEGRALSTTGAVSVDGVLAYTPIGCGSPVLSGPNPPALATASCFAIFSSNGSVMNTGISAITGDVGTNVGLTTGFDSTTLVGTIHPIPDTLTASAAADLLNVYNYLNTVTNDIELLYPAQFGNNLVLTPHTYLLNAATTLTDTLYLNAQGNANAVFVIKINGAFSTSTFAKVLLINGTQAENVYWKVEGSVDINGNSIFKGNVICNNGAINLNGGVSLEGRALSTNGMVSASAVTAAITSPCQLTGLNDLESSKASLVSIYPNPLIANTTVDINKQLNLVNCQLNLVNVLGEVVLSERISQSSSKIETGNLPAGIYFYQLINQGKIIQTGKLVSQQ
jgi:formylmethanofuran dehydrogenase subunit C